MGNKQRGKDRAYITRTEWNNEWGGCKKKLGAHAANAKFKSLPFFCCGLSLQPFEDPCCTKTNGTVYDITNLVPYVQKHKCHPSTGVPCTLKDLDLVKLHFHKNLSGDYWCPVLNKVFTASTHIVAIATTGNVYSYEAVNELNLKAKNYRDLLDETKTFAGKKDVITIQNPNDLQSRQLENFHCLEQNHDLPSSSKTDPAEGGIRVVSEDSRRILQHIGAGAAKRKTSGVLGGSKAAGPKSSALAESSQIQTGVPKKATSGLGVKTAGDGDGRLEARGRSTTGAVSRSFTSTSMSVQTKSEMEKVTRDLRPAKGKKGYVRLVTSLGDLNLELHCDICPRTCENFLTLCERGYYDKTIFHRSIPRFMVQGGDPTGTGRGGESIYGGPFKDELDSRLLHSARGVLAMANRGKNTNTSQFYVLYRQAPHLNYKHTVFGKVVGGLSTLDAIESVGTDDGDKPVQEVSILSTTVFSNPFTEMLDEEAREAKANKEGESGEVEDAGGQERGSWYSNPGAAAATATGQGIGKYLNKRPAGTSSKRQVAPGSGSGSQSKKFKSSYGNFDAW